MHVTLSSRFPMHKPLENYLEAPDGAGRLIAHARLLVRLDAIYQSIAPTHLRLSSRLANYKAGVVVLHAANGAVAVKLKQMAPTLAAGFSQRGVECTGVDIKVQAPDNPEESRHPTVKPLASGACAALNSLCESLPDTPLRQAFSHLLDRAEKSR